VIDQRIYLKKKMFDFLFLQSDTKAMQQRRLLVVEEDFDLGFGDEARTSGLSNASSGRLSLPRMSCLPTNTATIVATPPDVDDDDIVPQSAPASRISTRARASATSVTSLTPRHSGADNEEVCQARSSTASVEIVEEAWPIVTVLIDGVTVAVSDCDGIPMLDEASLGTVELKVLERARLAADRINRKLREMISRQKRGANDGSSAEESLNGASGVRRSTTVCDSTSDDDDSSNDSSSSSSAEDVESSQESDDDDFGSRRKKRGGKTKTAKRAPPSTRKKSSADVTLEGRPTDTLTKPELQAILRAANLPISGRKSALLRRVRQQRPSGEQSFDARSPPLASEQLPSPTLGCTGSPHDARCSQQAPILQPPSPAPASTTTPLRTAPLIVEDATPVLHSNEPSSRSNERSVSIQDATPRGSEGGLTQKIGFVTPTRIFHSFRNLFSAVPEKSQ
jgi:hypothetical protein